MSNVKISMETTRNKLPEKVEVFFKDLSDYLDTKILYYGSVQRADYFEGMSDIDVDIFTDNEHSLMTKLQHYLHLNKKEFKKLIGERRRHIIVPLVCERGRKTIRG